MKVILRKSVPKVGKKDDIVDVATGYAQNVLFPKNLAIAATPTALAQLERDKQNTAAEIAIHHRLLDKAIETLNKTETVSMVVKANAQGKLFSKIHAVDIARMLMDSYRIAIDPSLLILPEDSLKEIGQYTIRVVDGSYHGTFTLQLEQE